MVDAKEDAKKAQHQHKYLEYSAQHAEENASRAVDFTYAAKLQADSVSCNAFKMAAAISAQAAQTVVQNTAALKAQAYEAYQTFQTKLAAYHTMKGHCQTLDSVYVAKEKGNSVLDRQNIEVSIKIKDTYDEVEDGAVIDDEEIHGENLDGEDEEVVEPTPYLLKTESLALLLEKKMHRWLTMICQILSNLAKKDAKNTLIPILINGWAHVLKQ
ncbi:hypothetical protein C0995_007692 [Termitomyces sp. Mi166|nr:hypothetical protein C0995_007692 [Termitomyces sp. Mi166\